MSTHATATFAVKGWDEKPYKELDRGAKLTRASVTNAYEGDIEGQSILEYLMFYQGDGPTTFIGLEYIAGRVGDRSGSFVLQHSGTAEGSTVKSTYFVIPGSGTDGLRGLRGQGSATLSGHAQSYPMTLDYDFEK